MRLRELYVLRFTYPEGWRANISGPEGTLGKYFYFAEGRCDGRIAGEFRGANHPLRRTDRTFQTDLHGVIRTSEGAIVLVELQGYGRPHPIGRRQVVAAVKHASEDESYRWLNDALCVATGEVRSNDGGPESGTKAGRPPAEIESITEVVLEVAELVWEPPAE